MEVAKATGIDRQGEEKVLRTSVARMDGFDIPEKGSSVQRGVDQEWYAGYRQRLSGCGPSTATNILRYYSDRLTLPMPAQTKEEARALMELVWDYVTPTLMGLNTTQRYVEGIDKLQAEKGWGLSCRRLDISARLDERPDAAQVASFIREGLAADCPIAFLNLSRGSLENLDQWHWVTLVALEEDGEQLWAEAVDNGRMLRLDLSLWLETTTRGGGFVYCATGEASYRKDSFMSPGLNQLLRRKNQLITPTSKAGKSKCISAIKPSELRSG